MVGLLAAARAEADTGLTAIQLLESALRSPAALAVAAVVIAASMAPILKGARHEAFGAFSPRAEFLNGRAAMIGWAALLALEHKAGVPFF
jgi:4-hydroxy-L-threonine phosphate dehydrogenase PdxA